MAGILVNVDSKDCDAGDIMVKACASTEAINILASDHA